MIVSRLRRPGAAGRRTFLLAAVMALFPAAGCTNYRWTSDYQTAESSAQQQGKHLFIFYKWWLSDDSNRMHGDVLSDPAVARRLSDMENLLLEKESSPEYGRFMSRYGVHSAPAFVIVAPDGTFQVRTGFVPKDRFLEFIESARTPRPPRPGTRTAPTPQAAPRARVLVP